MKMEPLATCFPPLASPRAKILILGSFPGKESLRKQEYYGHPRNMFWPLLGSLLHFDAGLSYQERVRVLIARDVAVWDVMSSCRRRGSLDASIEHESIQVNDFLWFFNEYRNIQWVVFNGERAEKEYRRRVLKRVEGLRADLRYRRLPSTSPAMAALTRDEKLAQWARICVMLNGSGDA